MGLTSPPVLPQLRPDTKDLVCQILEITDYDFARADYGAIGMRNIYGVMDPTIQEADDFPNAAGFPPPSMGAYSGHGRPPFRLMPDQDSG
jgi:hypothetical protein